MTTEADYFDGQTARARRVRLQVVADQLVIDGDDGQRVVALCDIRWPERQRHGARIAHLANGGSLHSIDVLAWDALARDAGQHDALVIQAQQSWRGTLIAFVALLGVIVAGYLWGLPLATRAVLTFVPGSVDQALGKVVYESIDDQWLTPSKIDERDQQALRQALAAAVDTAYPAGDRPTYQIRFHDGRIGANALALPGGTIVVTDDLIKLAGSAEPLRTDIFVGVLGHELGHLRFRHGMRAVVQGTLIAAASSVVLGDFSSLLASAPALLASNGYSRDFERQADQESARLLRASGRSPAVMIEFFEKVAAARPAPNSLAIALASHPADAERIAFFRQAAGR